VCVQRMVGSSLRSPGTGARMEWNRMGDSLSIGRRPNLIANEIHRHSFLSQDSTLVFGRKHVPETVHAQTVANGGRAPFSVVVPGSRLPFCFW